MSEDRRCIESVRRGRSATQVFVRGPPLQRLELARGSEEKSRMVEVSNRIFYPCVLSSVWNEEAFVRYGTGLE